jgi:hypothetical protein
MLTGAQQHAADRFAKSLLALSFDALMDTYHQATEDYKAVRWTPIMRQPEPLIKV